MVDPRFTRTAAVSDYYSHIRPGSDIVFPDGDDQLDDPERQGPVGICPNFTNAAFIVKDEFGWSDGLFTGYDAEKRDYDKSSWDYVIGEDGFAQVDMTLQHPAASGTC